MKTYLCTCGVSVLVKRKINFDRLQHAPLSEREQFTSEINSLKERALDALECFKIPKDLYETSAEIKSLVHMGISSEDKVYLIATDTLDGQVCAEIVRDFLVEKKICSGDAISIKNIAGLQATDGRKFRKEGIKNLFDFLLRFEHEDAVFNPTGGFKSVVPYMALVGMLFNKPVRYIHEDSDDLISLADLPLVLNEDIIFPVEEKLLRIEQETAISTAEWQTGLDYHDHRFDVLVEEVEGQITLSGLGFLFWEKFKSDHPGDLLRTKMAPSQKKMKLGALGHHGKFRLKSIAEKLLRSHYVAGILNSCDFQPQSREWIVPLSKTECQRHLQVEKVNVCIGTDINSDAGYSMLVETTARTADENKRIAELLSRKLFR